MEESGYAGFIMPIEVYFKNKVGARSLREAQWATGPAPWRQSGRRGRAAAGVRVAAVSPGRPATSRGLAVAACPAAGGWFREVGRTSESRVRQPGAGRGRLVLLMKGQCLGMLSAGKASAGAAWGWDSEWFCFISLHVCFLCVCHARVDVRRVRREAAVTGWRGPDG